MSDHKQEKIRVVMTAAELKYALDVLAHKQSEVAVFDLQELIDLDEVGCKLYRRAAMVKPTL